MIINESRIDYSIIVVFSEKKMAGGNIYVMLFDLPQNSLIVNLILAIILIVVFMGYAFLLMKFQINKHVIPGTTICIITLSVFIGGLLNRLFLALILLVVGGLFYFSFYVITDRQLIVSYFDKNFSLLFVLLVTAYSFLMFKNSFLTGYDDFSHWGTVSKLMLCKDRFPMSADSIITFQSYPLGTASFIYFINRIIRCGEKGYLCAQFFMKTCLISCLFGLENSATVRKRLWTNLFISCFSIVLLVYNVSSFSLSVDTVLSCAGVFVLIAIYLSRESFCHATIAFILSSSLCIIIKNSGLFFWLVGLIVYMCVVKENKCSEKPRYYMALYAFVPIIILIIWQKHVNYVFANGLSSKHAMSITNWLKVFNTKSYEDIKYELSMFCSIIANPKSDRALIVLICSIILYLVLSRKQTKEMQKMKWLIVTMISSFLIYQIGAIVMYLFSMPHSEIVYQKGADYARYNGTLVSFLTCASVLLMLSFKDLLKKHLVISIVNLCFIILAIANKIHIHDLDLSRNTSVYYQDRATIKKEIENGLNSIRIDTGKPLMVRVTDKNNESNYVYYMMRYLLLSNNFTVSMISDDELFLDKWKKSDSVYCIDTLKHMILKK